MDPEFGCRLLDIIPLPPWEEELVWNIHVTEYWEKRIPLSHYVQPAIGGISAHGSQREEATSFPQFGLLPAELQLRILSVCPTATLFQLMQTSSFLRTEASKLFWGNPDAYFVVEAYWLLSGGFPGYKSYDLAFLQNVQNLQIDYDFETDAHLWPQDTGSDIIQQDQIATFWESIKWRFPNVRKVVLNKFREIDIPKRYNVVVPPLKALVKACPLTIEICMLMSEMRPPSNAQANTEIQPVATWQRCAYRLTSSHTWTELESRHSQTILLPIGGFTGLVGRFEALLWKWKRICLHRDSLWPLAIEALDRYHFDQGRNNPFICPFDDCNAYFDKAGAWTVHAATWHVPFFDRVRGSFPEEIRSLYEQRERWIKEMRRELCGKQCRSIWQEWTNAGADEQAMIERDWRRQLEAKRLGDVSEQAIRKEKHIWERFVDTANGTDEHWIREVDMYVDDEE